MSTVSLRLNADEAILLLVGTKLMDALVEAVEIDHVPQNAIFRRLVSRLIAQLPQGAEEMAERLVQELVQHFWPEDGDTDSPESLEESLQVVEQAIHEKRTLEVDYEAVDREEGPVKLVDPYAIHQAGSVYLLDGFCHWRRDRRVFRLDRMRRVVLTPHHFDRPASEG